MGEASGRKAEILDAAIEVFGEKGYDAGSMRDIAARVGVSEPAIYRHYSGKEALFIAVLHHAAVPMRNSTFALMDSIKPEHLREQMIAALRDRRRTVQRLAPLFRMALPAVTRNICFLDEYRNLIVNPARAKFAEKATEIDRAFDIPDADATRDARVRALLALIVGYMISSLVIGDEPDEVVVDAALRVMGWESLA